jgi:hypothetical protein
MMKKALYYLLDRYSWMAPYDDPRVLTHSTLPWGKAALEREKRLVDL